MHVSPGFRDALIAAGCQSRAGCVGRIDPTHEGSVWQLLDELDPEGVVCANDFTAAQLMRTLQSVDPDSLERIRIAGIDDVKYSSLLPVPLTTIHH